MNLSTIIDDLWNRYLRIKDTRPFIAAELFVVIAVSFAYFYVYQFSSTHLCGTDAYYHIKFSYITRTEGIIHNFHWAQFSLWRDHFFDKEFLYHIYLALFTYGDLIEGAKWATLIIGCSIFTSFFALLRLNEINYRWLWWLLLLSSGGYLLFRINVARPQTLSVLILIVGIHFLLNERHWIVGFISFLYSLSYTGHYQYVGLALIYLVITALRDEHRPWKVFVWALGGMILGWSIHPNFPHNVKGFFIQNVLVIWNHMQQTVNLNMGGELNPMSTRSLLNVCSASLIPLWLMFTISLARPFRLSSKTLFLFAASTIYLVMMMVSKRFGEYWVPVTGLLAAFYFNELPEELTPGGLRRERPWVFRVLVLVLLVGIPVLFIRSHLDTFPQLERCGESTYAPSARWLGENIPEGETVLTCDWDDAPHLFFQSHKHNYAVFLDPTFMYNWNPELWKRWNALANGKDNRPIQTILDYFKVNYMYCTSDFRALRQQLARMPEAELIYPRPQPDALNVACAVNKDCGDGTICRNDKCRPGQPCTKKTGRCVEDPHAYMFRIHRIRKR